MRSSGLLKDTQAIFAVIVGIDEYHAKDELPLLRGAANDAKAFKEFLTDCLQVPGSHIQTLTNETATRCAILSALESHFLHNPAIPDHGNTSMIFFFAGHGSRIFSERNLLSPDSKVEVICPVDERTLDPDGKYVHGIPDYVLAQFLQRLADKKGNNITCIMDSCHSGGMGRSEGLVRNACTESHALPPELDSHIWDDAIQTTCPHTVWAPSASSHVLLAACTQDGVAYETSSAPFHGRFTHSLIQALRRATLEDVTYEELINGLPSISQNPYCGGINKNRLVFATKRRRRSLAIIEQSWVDSDDVQCFLVAIGSVEGVVPGTRFSVRTADNIIVKLLARTVRINQTLLVSEDEQPLVLPKGSRAEVTEWRNANMILYMYLPADFPQTSDLFPLTNDTQFHNYVQAGSHNTAHLSLRRQGEKIALEWIKGSISLHAPETLFSPVNNYFPLHLPSVFDGIAHFYYFLEKSNGSASPGFSLEMHRLKGMFPNREPDRSQGNDGNLIASNKVCLQSEKGARYGFTMRNTSCDDLFPYLFYFNPRHFTIQCWYLPQSAHDRPPLYSSGTLTVGMGGERAFFFRLPANETSSPGFITMFASTEYLDLAWIEQKISPFDHRFPATGRLKMSHELRSHSTGNALCVDLTLCN
ncbi:caspase domain-containing protein [Mycena galericulata]|nr:caspase domain-containing protein [Mycena galericulata]